MMSLSNVNSLLAVFLLVGSACASAQTQDNSQNALLKGSYSFRDIAVQNVDSSYDPTEITASSGTITFDGAGNYIIAGTMIDNVMTNGLPQALNVTGTYAIGSNGLGYLTNPIYPADSNAYIYGAVAQGVYTGSSTESQGDGNIFNDIFVAIPLGAAPANAGFTSSYQTAVLDFTGAGSTAIKNALFELNPNGKGGFGAISLTGQAANQFGTLTQSIAGATYNFNSDSSATLTIPLPTGVTSGNALLTGSKTMFESADGNFILGWTSTGYDIFFGVKALPGTGSNALMTGLYFTAGLEDLQASEFGTDSYYGGFNNSGDSAGDGLVHERLNIPNAASIDYGIDDQTILNPNGTTGNAGNGFTDLNGYEYLFGAAGQAFVAIGTGGNFSLVVGMHAAAFSGPGVYLSPIGVVNAASFQPVTASIAPGELLELFGTGLSSTTLATPGGQVFSPSLGGVSVAINGAPCPVYAVSPTHISVSVPYEVALNQTGLANIQVTNNNVASNVVQMYLTDSAPGSFSQSANGIGYAAATHALTGALITTTNPAQPNEYISLYLTGPGTVTPTVADGALGPYNPLSWSDLYNAGNLTVYFDDFTSGSTGNVGKISFAGLAPTLAGLYQINVQVPANVLGAGDNIYIAFVTDAAQVEQIQIPYGGSGTSLAVPAARARAKGAVIGAAHATGSRSTAHPSGRGKPASGSE